MALDLGVDRAPGADRRRRRASSTRSPGSTRSIWGQVDSFGTVFLLLGMRELWRGRAERAAVLAVVAALIKPQLAILVPIVAVVVDPAGPVARPAAIGDEGAPRRRGLSAASGATAAAIRILTTAAAGFLTAVVAVGAVRADGRLGLGDGPFLESSLLRLVFSTAATYPYLTVNAYNPWALFPVERQEHGRGTALWIRDVPGPGRATWGAIGPIPAVVVGAALLLVAVAVVACGRRAPAGPAHDPRRGVRARAGLLRRPDPRPRAVPVPALRRWRRSCSRSRCDGGSRTSSPSIATFLNMYVVLTTLYPDNPADLGLAGDRRGDPLVVGRHDRRAGPLGGFCLGRPAAASRRAARLAAALEHRGGRRATGPGAAPRSPACPRSPAGRRTGDGRRPAVDRARRAGAAGARPRAGRPAATAAARDPPRRSALVPAWYEPAVLDGAGPDRRGSRARVGETPIRPDRSRAPRPRARRAPRPAGPVAPGRARRRGAGPAHVPARRARPGCTSTRSTTPGPPRSSSRTGATASPTTSTSGPTRTSRST